MSLPTLQWGPIAGTSVRKDLNNNNRLITEINFTDVMVISDDPCVLGVTGGIDITGQYKINGIPINPLGEINTASNVGVGGFGLFKQKTGVNLEFKNVNIASNKLSLTESIPNNELILDVIPGNISHTTLSDIGVNSHI